MPATIAMMKGIGDDPDEPWTERAVGIVPAQMPQGCQEPVLGSVVRVVGVTEDRAGDTPCLTSIPLHQLPERLPISASCISDVRIDGDGR